MLLPFLVLLRILVGTATVSVCGVDPAVRSLKGSLEAVSPDRLRGQDLPSIAGNQRMEECVMSILVEPPYRVNVLVRIDVGPRIRRLRVSSIDLGCDEVRTLFAKIGTSVRRDIEIRCSRMGDQDGSQEL